MWAVERPGSEVVTRYIQRDVWRALELCNGPEKECRNARLINDMLSAFEDRVQGELAPHLEAVRARYKAYSTARDAHKRADISKKPDRADAAAQSANDGLRQTWVALVDLLYESKRLRPAENDAAFRSVERQTAEILAKVTDPIYLLCAADVMPAQGEIRAALRPMLDAVTEGGDNASEKVNELGNQRAMRLFSGALRLALPEELLTLRRAADKSVGIPCKPGSSVLASRAQSSTQKNLRAHVEPRKKAVSREGVQREGTGSGGDALDKDLDEIDELWGDLAQLGASGFDRGRPQLGLDRLSDEAAVERFKDRGRRRGSDDIDDLADSGQTKQLQDSAVDLASRMQFLAVNMELVGSVATEPGRNEDAFKATLESIANTLLVLAEDQRRQRTHRHQQKDFAGDEYRSAVEAFQVDAARRFDQLIGDVRTKLADQQAEEKKLAAKRDDDLVTAKKAHKTAQAVLAEKEWAQFPLIQLHITLLGRRPAEPPSAVSASLESSGDTPARWKRDQTSLAAAFKGAPAVTSAQHLRGIAASWLDQQLSSNMSIATTKDLRRVRLIAAQDALRLLRTNSSTEQVRAKAIQQMQDQLLLALKLASDSTALARTVEATARIKVDEATTAASIKPTAASTPPSSIDLQAALDVLKAQGVAVVASAVAAKNVHDAATISGLVSAALSTAAAAVAADKRAPYVLAQTLVADWLKDAREDLKVLGKQPASAQNTLDRIEAYLSYRRVEAVARNGATSAPVKDITEAMDALMKRRERMGYLRPASMYLRSALATTGQQADPGLEWNNLLWATVNRMSGAKTPAERQTEAVRATLDKSFWQSVNKVRVSAAGSSNFAIAKDDIGNWYVKAMGSDSEAMIKAAKSLALFNIGGRVDTNLLRIDELRNKADRQPAETTELKDLVDRKNGAAAGAYGSTLLVFSENHAKTVKGLLAALNEDIKLNRPFDAISARWTKTYADNAKKLALLTPLLQDADLRKLHERALAGAAPADPQPPGTTPSSQLIETLDLLVQQRSRLKTLVSKLDLLSSDEISAAKVHNDIVGAQETMLAVAQAEQTALLQKRAALQDQRDTTLADKVDVLKLLDTQIAEQQKAANSKSQEVIILRVKLLEEQVKAGKLNTLRDAAKALQARAVDDAETVMQKLTKDVAFKHLRAVEEFETAARVVSQGVQGKAARK